MKCQETLPAVMGAHYLSVFDLALVPLCVCCFSSLNVSFFSSCCHSLQRVDRLFVCLQLLSEQLVRCYPLSTAMHLPESLSSLKILFFPLQHSIKGNNYLVLESPVHP